MCVLPGLWQTSMLLSALEVVCDSEDGGDDDSAVTEQPCPCDRAARGLCGVLLRLVSSSRLFAKQFEEYRGLDTMQVIEQAAVMFCHFRVTALVCRLVGVSCRVVYLNIMTGASRGLDLAFDPVPPAAEVWRAEQQAIFGAVTDRGTGHCVPTGVTGP